jgi:hypothetical protein
MSRDRAGNARHQTGAPAHRLPKPRGEPAIQQKIACANLLNTVSAFMTGRFSTAC